MQNIHTEKSRVKYWWNWHLKIKFTLAPKMDFIGFYVPHLHHPLHPFLHWILPEFYPFRSPTHSVTSRPQFVSFPLPIDKLGCFLIIQTIKLISNYQEFNTTDFGTSVLQHSQSLIYQIKEKFWRSHLASCVEDKYLYYLMGEADCSW